jgi:ABC-type phosphate transport system substrate-binding protein
MIEVPYSAGPVTLAFSNNIPGVTLPTIANPNCVNNPTAPCAVPTIPNLKLTRKAYCGIFTGTITNWGDLEISTYNTALKNKTATINVVRRSDSSGTTDIFTNHLREVCDGVYGTSTWLGGAGGTVTWPAQANFRSANTNSGMATEVLNPAFPGSIGYITADFTSIAPTPALSPAPNAAYVQNDASVKAVAADLTGATKPKFYAASAKQAKVGIPTVALPVGGGSAITGVASTFNHTPAIASLVDGSGVICSSCITQKIPNPTATAAYPIIGFSYVLFYQKYPATDIGGVAIPSDVDNKLVSLTTTYMQLSPVTAKTGATTDADDVATLEGFVPLSPALKKQVRDLVSTSAFKITN